MNLLIVEDDEKQLQMYNDLIDSFSKKNGMQIDRACFSNLAEGMAAINSSYFDAAIIDLKLSGNSDKLEGMDIVDAINGKLRIPIYIVSGSIAQVDIEENILLKKRLRDGDFKIVLEEIKLIFDTGITRFLMPGGKIDVMLSQIFWKHLSNDLNNWINNNNPDTLIRYIFSHFYEYLDITSDGDFQEYHPSEVYIKPKVKKNIHTGDILDIDGNYYIVLTPACDMVLIHKPDAKGAVVSSRKADSMLVASVLEFTKEAYYTKPDGSVDKGKISALVKNESYRYHYLPPYINKTGFIIDFQKLNSIDFTEKIKPVASVSAPFIKDIISRFANYYSRQGQPTFNQSNIIQALFEEASSKKVAS